MMLVVLVSAGWSSLQNLVEASGAGVPADSGAAVAGNCITNLFLYKCMNINLKRNNRYIFKCKYLYTAYCLAPS